MDNIPKPILYIYISTRIYITMEVLIITNRLTILYNLKNAFLDKLNSSNFWKVIMYFFFFILCYVRTRPIKKKEEEEDGLQQLKR